MISLPIDELLLPITESLKSKHNNLVIVAAPGAGKTTRVAPALMSAGLNSAAGTNDFATMAGEILLLQPRQVAARSLAQRIADEQNWRLGQEVGYQVRFENRTSRQTKLKLITEGILTRRLQQDPYLEGVSIVILDEFHERSLHTDLAIALLRELQKEARPDLKIIVMSATIDALPISRYLGACPIFESQGRLFPVEVKYLTQQVNTLDFHELMRETARVIKICALEKPKAAEGPAHILVFLPGTGEINFIKQTLTDWASQNNLVIWPLHGRLAPEEQDFALTPSSARKIILATNIAETSLTIDGVSRVIDSGLARVNRIDCNLGIEKLELTRISLASATQRAGRAGRQSPGQCYRLWTMHDERSFSDSQEPEIMRVPLNEAWLFLADQGHVDPIKFNWFQPPPPTALKLAVEQLKAVQALDLKTGHITAIGRELLKWPLAPRLARLMIEAVKTGAQEQGALVAALLSERDIFKPKAVHGMHGRLESDILLRVEALQEFEAQGGRRNSDIDQRSARTVLQLRDQILAIARAAGAVRAAGDAEVASRIKAPDGSKVSGGAKIADAPKNAEPDSVSNHNRSSCDDATQLLKLLLIAFNDRVCRRRKPGEPRALMVGLKGVKLDPTSCVRQAEFFVALDAQNSGQTEPLVRLASAIEKTWLEEFFAAETKDVTRSFFEAESEKAFSITNKIFRDLPLEEGRKNLASRDEAGPLLAAFITENFEKYFSSDSSAGRWVARYRFAQKNIPGRDWPALDEEIIKPALIELTYECQTLGQALIKPVTELFQNKLSHELQKILNLEVPEVMGVPSGSVIKINYNAGQPPTASVRLQEVFGLNETPRVAFGTVPVILHLLSPGYKPVQVTSDLKNFWKNTYFEVRKELKGRYPKHSWPEDPVNAVAVAKGRRR